jgi:hypothetical protein
MADWLSYSLTDFLPFSLETYLRLAEQLTAGRPWMGVSLFGSAPDATAIGTLGLAALLAPRLRWLLLPVPVLWCLLSALLRWGLGDPLWLVPGLAAMAVMLALPSRAGRSR